MGQNDVVSWLAVQYRFDRFKYFTVKEIAEGLKRSGRSCNGNTEQMVRRAVKKLLRWGQIEADTEDDWRKAYRFNA